MKYKVWHIDLKKWIHDWNVYINPDGDVYEIEERGSYDRYMNQEWLTKKVKVVYSTGLTDRNGVEIYEGDLYKIEGNWPIYQVIFDEKTAAFGLKSNSGPFYSFGKLQERNEIISEKLGNIYSTPQLLK